MPNCLPVKAYGQQSGCWVATLIRLDGPPVEKWTLWNTWDLSPIQFIPQCMYLPDMQETAMEAKLNWQVAKKIFTPTECCGRPRSSYSMWTPWKMLCTPMLPVPKTLKTGRLINRRSLYSM